MTRAALIKRIDGLRMELQMKGCSVSSDCEDSFDNVIEQIQKELEKTEEDLKTGNYEVVGY